MLNPATVYDLETLWRPLEAGADTDRAQARLDQAWRALRAAVPTVVARVEAGTLSAELVADVICSATLRILQNPEGHESGAESIDDYSESWKYAATRSNDLYFTAAELRRLSPSRSRAFTISLG